MWAPRLHQGGRRSSRPGLERAADSGTATLEFALFALVAVWLLLAGTDMVSYMRSRLRVDEVSTSLARLVTGYQQLYAGDFPGLFQAGQVMAGAVQVGGSDGATIITGLVNLSGAPVVAWRQQSGNAGFTSAFGPVGGVPVNLPDDYALPAGSSIVAVEVFSSIHPWVLGESVMGSQGSPTLRGAALYQPRASLLSQVTPGARP